MTWVRDWWLAWPKRWAVARVVCLKKGLTAKDATDLRPITILLRVYSFWSAYRSSLGITTYISACPLPTAIAGTCHFRTYVLLRCFVALCGLTMAPAPSKPLDSEPSLVSWCFRINRWGTSLWSKWPKSGTVLRSSKRWSSLRVVVLFFLEKNP